MMHAAASGWTARQDRPPIVIYTRLTSNTASRECESSSTITGVGAAHSSLILACGTLIHSAKQLRVSATEQADADSLVPRSATHLRHCCSLSAATATAGMHG